MLVAIPINDPDSGSGSVFNHGHKTAGGIFMKNFERYLHPDVDPINLIIKHITKNYIK